MKKPRKLSIDHESTTKGRSYRVNQLFLSLTNLKNVPLDTPIIEAASVFVISCFKYLSNISSVLGGVDAFGLPNLKLFYIIN